MKKTHEKSSIYAVTGTDSVKNIKKDCFTDGSNRTHKRRYACVFS